MMPFGSPTLSTLTMQSTCDSGIPKGAFGNGTILSVIMTHLSAIIASSFA